MKRFFLAMIVALSTFFCGSAIASEGTFIGNTIKGIDHVYYFLANPVGSLTLDGDAVLSIKSIDLEHGTFTEPYVLMPSLNVQSAFVFTLSDFARAGSVAEKHGISAIITSGLIWGISKISTLGNSSSLNNLTNAWLFGRSFVPYNVVCFDTSINMNNGKYVENWHFLGTQMDGASIFAYTLSWVIHTPQKFIRNIAYILHNDDISILVLLDIVTNAIQLMFECVFACCGFVINTILGTICHPLDTLCSIPGCMWFSCVSVVTAVIDVFTSVWALFTGFGR